MGTVFGMDPERAKELIAAEREQVEKEIHRITQNLQPILRKLLTRDNEVAGEGTRQ